MYNFSTDIFLRHKCQLSFLCQTKLLIIVTNFRLNAYLISKISAIFYVYTNMLFYPKNTNVRKFQFPCYIWHLWRHVLVQFSVATYCILDNLFGIKLVLYKYTIKEQYFYYKKSFIKKLKKLHFVFIFRA